MTVQERIRAFCDYKKISIRQFEIQSKMSNGYVSSMRKSVGLNKLENVLNAFPELNRDWLLYGEGEMITGKETVKTFESKSEEKRSTRSVPVYNLEATAGFVSIYKDYSQVAENFLSIPNLPPVDGAIYARGDSMSPLIESGDIVIFQKVQNPGNILWGNIYIVSYFLEGDEYTVLKYIKRSPLSGHIRLESFNTRYDPQDIPTYSIVALALVKASITFHTIG